MNQHLTWEQISDYMIGGPASQYAPHARECGSCGSEVARFESALSEFRGAVRQWSSKKCRPEFETSIVMGTGAAAHLDRLLMTESLVEVPWYQRLGAGFGSLAAHAAVIALLLFVGTLKPVQVMVTQVATLIAPPPPLKVIEHKGGGGGGARQPMEKKAELPKPTPRRFVAPRTDTVQTRLEAPASLMADLPDLNPTAIGDLAGLNALNGAGYGTGIGTGRGGGVGGGTGNGYGSGGGGGTGGGVYKPGNGVTNPVPIYRPEPQYSEEARKAKWQGAVLLSLVVDQSGKPTEIKVITPLGLGLDEKAIEAVAQWKFKPGTLNGRPVKVQAQVQVSFRLL